MMTGPARGGTGAPAVSRRLGQPVLPYPRGRRRRRWLSSYRIVLAAVLLSSLFGGLIYLSSPSQSLVVASVPFWNIDYGTTSVLSNRNTFSETSPWIYGLSSSGQIVPQYAAAQAAMVDAQLARLRAARIPLVPTLANVVQGKWVYQPVITDILHNPRVRARHVAAIVALVLRQDYAGIDIDYEDLLASDRTPSPPSSPRRPVHCTPRARCCPSTCSPSPPIAAMTSAISRRTTRPSAGSPTRCG